MTICEKITQLFPIRKTAAQKRAFRQWVMGEMSRMGYRARVEENDNGRQQNIVVGDPVHAEVTFTAHYDTPATILLPDLQIPRNFPVYLLWQLLIIGGMLLISLVAGLCLGLLTGNGDVMIFTFFGAFLVLMWLQLYGFANRNNVNDNTSGVATILETMARIPEEDRSKTAFILFDNMEKGRKGSKAWARDHLEAQHTRFFVNVDSVGVGDVFLASASSLAMQMPQYAALQQAADTIPGRECRFHSSVTTRVNSDFRSFKCGVGISAYRQVSGVGLYLGDLHTARDTQADQNNIEGLAEAFSGLVKQL
ncbi:MAG: Zn-dependent exopeptidase M28 [Clostridiales bacterium]|nr:Zn-dependent exopeptidase M28 [Clostridiales bacterium]